MNIQTRTDPVARARELGPEIAAAADEIERTRRIPGGPAGADARRSGCSAWCCRARPAATRSSLAVYVAALEEIARHDGSIGWNTFAGNSSALIAPFLDADVNRTIFGNPRTVVSWGPPNASRARAVEGGYRLTGKWDFSSGCRQANWMGAHGHVVEADGSLRLNRFGRPTVRTLLFPAEQATLIDTWHTIGLRGTASDSYSVDDLFVPEAFSTTREDPTLRREKGPLYAFTMQGLYAAGVAARRARHCARDAGRVRRSRLAQGAARAVAARRQRAGAGRCGAHGGAARLGARLSASTR